MKGLLSVDGMNERFAFQDSPDRAWGLDEPRINKIVFIGKNLDEQEIEKGFKACLLQQIRDMYRQLCNQSLVDRLNSELSGDFRTSDPAERDARLANEVLRSKRKGIAELQVIIEIARATLPHHLVAVRQPYCSMFHCSLEEDIISKGPVASKEMVERRAEVVGWLKALEEVAAPLIGFLQNPTAVQELRSYK